MATRRKKKAIGRPSKKVLPPRIDATPEQIAQVVLNAGRPQRIVSGTLYYCRDCKRQVAFPETLYNDNRCESCHKAADR